MDLSLLRTFVTVHRAGSFTRAAALLGLSQPAVTSQIRALERQLGRPLFLRRARGVTPTTVGDELAHRAAPHLDALVDIVEAGLDEESGTRTLHLAGPPEFTSVRALPALTPLISQGLALRSTFVTNAEDMWEGLAAGHHDLAITTARPRGGLMTSTTLCDEEHVLVAAPRWAGHLGPGTLRHKGSVLLEQLPVVEVHESLLDLALLGHGLRQQPGRCGRRDRTGSPGCSGVRGSGRGLAVLPRYLCEGALERGEVVALLDPPVPPLRTYFLIARTGTLGLPHIARAHEWLVRAAVDW